MKRRSVSLSGRRHDHRGFLRWERLPLRRYSGGSVSRPQGRHQSCQVRSCCCHTSRHHLPVGSETLRGSLLVCCNPKICFLSGQQRHWSLPASPDWLCYSFTNRSRASYWSATLFKLLPEGLFSHPCVHWFHSESSLNLRTISRGDRWLTCLLLFWLVRLWS